jgi:hypothetical protein
VSTTQITFVLAPNGFEMALQGRCQLCGQDGHAILATLAVPHRDLVADEVEILDAQPCAFEQSKPRAIQARGHQPGDAGHAGQYGGDLVAGENQWKPNCRLCPNHLRHPGEVALEDLPVEEQKSAEGLALGGGTHPAGAAERGEVLRNFGRPQLVGWRLSWKRMYRLIRRT